jgi:AhpD family alkylhydroperoxidase
MQAQIDALQERDSYVSDISLALRYRPELFGEPFSELLQDVMKGPSDWTEAERELFAAFVSAQNQCPFWTESHGAVASYAFGNAELVDAVLGDYETAPIDDRLKGALHFLATLDPAPALAAGVSLDALRDAAEVKAAFDLIARFADAIGAKPHSEQGLTREEAITHEGRFFELGYA